MEKEDRYVVIKRSDLERAAKILSDDDIKTFNSVCNFVRKLRYEDKKDELECVVVEHDWPMYEDTWKAIENWVDSGAYVSLQVTNDRYEEALKKIVSTTSEVEATHNIAKAALGGGK